MCLFMAVAFEVSDATFSSLLQPKNCQRFGLRVKFSPLPNHSPLCFKHPNTFCIINLWHLLGNRESSTGECVASETESLN